MEWLLGVDAIGVLIDQILNGNMANVDANKDILCMEQNA